MSFLTPLYALGVLAIGLPILFHLIQRRPKGQKDFSSTMFLTASPPRLTKRSRLENWPLLLLRTAAIVLLALAFARPFMRSLTQLDTEPPGRQVLVLMDTSASMQREDLWQQAIDELDGVLEEIKPADQIALATYDSTFSALASFEQTSNSPSSSRAATIKSALSDVSPGWAATDLGSALVAAADLLHATAEDRDKKLAADVADATDTAARQSEIILISDMQTGSNVEQLNGYQWPNDIRLSLRSVVPSKKGNATLTVLATDESTESDLDSDDGGQLRVRVRNDAASQQQQFRLVWVKSSETIGPSNGEVGQGDPKRREYSVQVPPGETRVVRVDREAGHELTLLGDDHPFDNLAYVADQMTLSKQLLYVGDRDDAPETGLSYYLNRATIDTARVSVEFEQLSPNEFLLAPKPGDVPLIVVGPMTAGSDDGGNGVEGSNDEEGSNTDGIVSTLRSYLNAGGRVLVAAAKSSNGQADVLRPLMELDDLVIGDATVADYAMLSTIDFQHPLFHPFADPRFNDFTKIRFWSHRIIEAENLESDGRRVLARFDDRSPALIEQTMGKGRLWVLAAGWQSAESQLALSTKFIPLIYGMFDPTRGHMVTRDNYFVGQVINSFPESNDENNRLVIYPDGTSEELAVNELPAFEEPGVYQLVDGEVRTPFAINVSPNEGSTSPLDVSELEKYGVQTARTATVEQLQSAQRQMRDVELEGGQKIWRWLILAALAILGIETLLGGWFANRQSVEPVPA